MQSLVQFKHLEQVFYCNDLAKLVCSYLSINEFFCLSVSSRFFHSTCISSMYLTLTPVPLHQFVSWMAELQEYPISGSFLFDILYHYVSTYWNEGKADVGLASVFYYLLWNCQTKEQIQACQYFCSSIQWLNEHQKASLDHMAHTKMYWTQSPLNECSNKNSKETSLAIACNSRIRLIIRHFNSYANLKNALELALQFNNISAIFKFSHALSREVKRHFIFDSNLMNCHGNSVILLGHYLNLPLEQIRILCYNFSLQDSSTGLIHLNTYNFFLIFRCNMIAHGLVHQLIQPSQIESILSGVPVTRPVLSQLSFSLPLQVDEYITLKPESFEHYQPQLEGYDQFCRNFWLVHPVCKKLIMVLEEQSDNRITYNDFQPNATVYERIIIEDEEAVIENPEKYQVVLDTASALMQLPLQQRPLWSCDADFEKLKNANVNVRSKYLETVVNIALIPFHPELLSPMEHCLSRQDYFGFWIEYAKEKNRLWRQRAMIMACVVGYMDVLNHVNLHDEFPFQPCIIAAFCNRHMQLLTQLLCLYSLKYRSDPQHTKLIDFIEEDCVNNNNQDVSRMNSMIKHFFE